MADFAGVRRIAGVLLIDLRLGLRNVFRQRRRSTVGLGAVAGGVVALLLAAGFFEFNYDLMRESTIRARIGHIQVTRPGYLEAGTANPFRHLLPISAPERQHIESLPEVDVLAPRVVFSGLISLGESTLSFLGEGVDPQREQKLSGALAIRQGRDLAAGDRNSVILGRGLAENLGAKVGQSVVLLVTTAAGGINAVELQVRGVFETVTKAYDDYALRIPLETSQQLLRTSGVHLWLVLLRRTSQTDDVLAHLRAALPSSAVQLTPWYATPVADFYNKTVALFSKQVLVVEVMIAVLIVLSISNIMMASVRERVAEIGTYMALGDRRSTTMRRFLAEGVILGVVGGAMGAVIGIGLARLISWIGIPMPPPPGMASSYVSQIMVTPGLVLNALSLTVVTAFVAGLYPAWRAAHMNIVDALRHAR